MYNVQQWCINITRPSIFSKILILQIGSTGTMSQMRITNHPYSRQKYEKYEFVAGTSITMISLAILGPQNINQA